jgi:hypothetical protein
LKSRFFKNFLLADGQILEAQKLKDSRDPDPDPTQDLDLDQDPDPEHWFKPSSVLLVPSAKNIVNTYQKR